MVFRFYFLFFFEPALDDMDFKNLFGVEGVWDGIGRGGGWGREILI